MNKKIIAVLAALFTLSSAVFAIGKNKPNEKRIAVVGKINLVSDSSRDFIAKTRGITETKVQDRLFFSSDYTTFYADPGEYFVWTLPRGKDGFVNFDSAFSYYYFGSSDAILYLPTGFKVKISDDMDAIYIGDFTYRYTGDFNLQKVDIKYSYENAQKALDEFYDTHYDLARVQIITEDTESKN